MSYTKLFASIITSTLWSEDDRTRIVWITLMACADKNGEFQGSIPGLARIAGVPVEDCRNAIAKFLSPDPDSRTKDDEGRRIEEIPGGWALLNYRKYRDMASDEDRKRAAAERQQRVRDRKSRNSHAESRTSHAPVTGESLQKSQAEAEAEAEAEANPKKKERGTFVPPTHDEVMEQAGIIGLPESEARKFIPFYSSKGWMVGKTKMKSWVMALSGWKARWDEKNPPPSDQDDIFNLSHEELKRRALG
jgi:hypothetical protein